jgi:hypothetical protein
MWSDGIWKSVSYGNLPKIFANANMAVSYAAAVLDRRRKGQILSTEGMQAINKEKSRMPSTEAAWHLVQTNTHGKPIDCDYYRELAEGKK